MMSVIIKMSVILMRSVTATPWKNIAVMDTVAVIKNCACLCGHSIQWSTVSVTMNVMEIPSISIVAMDFVMQ